MRVQADGGRVYTGITVGLQKERDAVVLNLEVHGAQRDIDTLTV